MRKLSEWLTFIEQKNPDHMHLGLDHLQPVAARLDVINWPMLVITIAGTNGKGSTLTALETFLIHANKKVGAYTSPHLIYFNERIKINALPVADELLCEAFAQVDQAREQQALTYFEWATLAALWIFKQADLEFLLLEVGLGGRLDAVNLVQNNISLITGIDYDHQAWLGDTLEEIAREKTGIFKLGQIALCGQRQAPAIIAEQAQKLNLRFLDRSDFSYEKKSDHWSWWGENSVGEKITYENLPDHTIPFSNLALAIQTLQFLLPEVTADFIRRILPKIQVPGRLQFLPTDKPVIVDVAHNRQSMAYLAAWLQQQTYRNIYLVMGVLADKDYASMIQPLLPLISEWFVGNVDSARGLSAQSLQQQIVEQGGHAQCYANISSAYDHACAVASSVDVVVVCGSFYAVAPILRKYS